MIDINLLKKYADEIGIDLGTYGAQRFDDYAQRLVRWNEHTNLTSITEPEEIVIKHFIDCLYMLKFVDIRPGESVVDVGTGAGFPGVPILIAQPEAQLTLVDSLGKRLAFLDDVLKTIGLCADTVHMRAEDAGRDEDLREQFDYATARAVAPLNVLCEYCLPFVKVGGLFVSMKGASIDEEVESAKNAIDVLGGELAAVEHFELPNGDKRGIAIIKKISQTPTKYPRKPKKISAKPL